MSTIEATDNMGFSITTCDWYIRQRLKELVDIWRKIEILGYEMYFSKRKEEKLHTTWNIYKSGGAGIQNIQSRDNVNSRKPIS